MPDIFLSYNREDQATARRFAEAFEADVFEQTFRNIDDVLWKEAGCTTELDYVEQTSCCCSSSTSMT